MEKRFDTTVNGLPVTKVFSYVYDNEDIILEIVETTVNNGAPTTETIRYVHGPGVDEPLLIQKNGIPYYYHADGLGSIAALTDFQQNVVESYRYTAYGLTTKTGDIVNNNFRFTGREFDPEIGIYYYRARYYDPGTGRFITKDPIGFAGGVNLYLYTGNNPVNRIDPLGLDWIDDLADFSAGMGDTLTFGGTKLIREQWNEAYGWGEDAANQCSDFYTAGKWSGYALEAALGAGLSEQALQIEVNVLSKGNVLKIISKKLRRGFRIDPAHHGKRWGHPHWWKW
ncbi:MAG: RHS repeat-associated core domain-containing protein [Deltaproteobacteria bacterium]|nr:RHS repeat-associated core domain-containing protein [Deltaproteobacteria bacterium]